MIEAIILKLCFDENQLQQYLEDHNKIATVIHASYNEEQEEIDCYFVRIENPDGNAGRSANAIITASTAPTWTTSAGSLGTIAGNFSGTVATVAATSDSAIAYSEVSSPAVLIGSGSGQANCTLDSSTGVIATTDFGGSSTTPTLYTFTLRATDAEGQTADRVFTLQSSFGATGGGQFN